MTQLSTKAQSAAAEKAFRQAINHCRVAIATGKMFNIGDIGNYLGIPHTALGDSSVSSTTPVSVMMFNLTILPKIEEYRKRPPTEAVVSPIEQAPVSSKTLDEVTSVYEEHPLDKLNWIPPRHPKQKVTQFPFQAKATKDCAYKLCIEDRRAVLLRASVGVGKTYIYGQLLRWLWDHDNGSFFKCVYGPWKALIITKASIVEQTRRVMVDDFGLDPHRQVCVMNYDALRSTKGLETMLESSFMVVNAERVRVIKWKPFMRPRLVIIDESQSAKNEDATQSKIIFQLAKYNDMSEPDNCKLIASSATPFTRVSEAKYFVINAGIPYRMV